MRAAKRQDKQRDKIIIEELGSIANAWCTHENHKQIMKMQGKDYWGRPLAGGTQVVEASAVQVRSPDQPPPSIDGVQLRRVARPTRHAAPEKISDLRPIPFGPTYSEIGSGSVRFARRVMRVALLFVMVLIAIVVFAVVLGLSVSR